MSGYDSVNRNVLESSVEGLSEMSNSGAVNRRLDEAVAAGRAKSSATWKVGNVGERAKVRRCTAVVNLVYQDDSLGLDVFSSVETGPSCFMR